MNEILLPILILGGIGLVFGLGLTLANKIFYVKTDPKLIEVKSAMPGANCGGCGYPGCDACAVAVYEGKAPVDVCPVGGSPLANKIALIMGVELKTNDIKLVAKVRCQGSSDKCGNKFEYVDIQDCRAAVLVNGGNKKCEYGCLGLGSCAAACKFDALHIDKDTKLPVVNDELCVACGACVTACPKKLINLQPINLPVRVLCMNLNKGKVVKETCSIGCIGCTMCARKCESKAITMVNDLPIIDNDLCIGCMVCANVCPTKAIKQNLNYIGINA